MPLLNVNTVLASPFLVDRFQVRRRTSVIGQNGRNANKDTVTWQSGVVQPDGNNTQERNKEEAHGNKTISVICKFPLRDQTRCDQLVNAIPDIVIWRGDEYLVDSVEDLTNYGPGFVEATCISQDAQDKAPGRQ